MTAFDLAKVAEWLQSGCKLVTHLPEFSKSALMVNTRLSSSPSVNLLYVSIIARSHSCIRLCSVFVDTPNNVEINGTERSISIRRCRCSLEMRSLGRPMLPGATSTTTVFSWLSFSVVMSVIRWLRPWSTYEKNYTHFCFLFTLLKCIVSKAMPLVYPLHYNSNVIIVKQIAWILWNYK